MLWKLRLWRRWKFRALVSHVDLAGIKDGCILYEMTNKLGSYRIGFAADALFLSLVGFLSYGEIHVSSTSFPRYVFFISRTEKVLQQYMKAELQMKRGKCFHLNSELIRLICNVLTQSSSLNVLL